jgi:hypothetical protein
LGPEEHKSASREYVNRSHHLTAEIVPGRSMSERAETVERIIARNLLSAEGPHLDGPHRGPTPRFLPSD